AYRLYARLADGPLTRAELAELWSASGWSSLERAHRRGLHGRKADVLESLFRECFVLHELLCREVSAAVDGAASGELESRVPPDFLPRTYLVVDPTAPAQVDAAIAAVRRERTVWPLTEAALKTYLSYRNPWEHAPLAARNPGLALVAPSPAA